MEIHLLASPAGFSSAISAINMLSGSGDVFTEFVAEVVEKTQAYGRISVDAYREKLGGAGVNASARDVNNAALGIEFIVTCVVWDPTLRRSSHSPTRSTHSHSHTPHPPLLPPNTPHTQMQRLAGALTNE